MAANFLGLTIETLRQHAGLAPSDASKDAEIEAAFLLALETLEAYLDRWLTLAAYTEQEVHVVGREISLKAYPLQSVESLKGDSGAALAYHAEKPTGVLKLDSFICYHTVDIEYTGGFQILPGPLQMALLATFDNVWAVYSPTDSGGAKEVKAMTVDGMRVEYNVSSTSASASAFGAIPASALSMLDPYRRVYA